MKRGADDQLTPTAVEQQATDEAEGEDTEEDGTFKRASADKLKGRRILKARRLGAVSSTSSSTATDDSSEPAPLGAKLSWNLTAPASESSSSASATSTEAKKTAISETSNGTTPETSGATASETNGASSSTPFSLSTASSDSTDSQKRSLSLQSSLGGLGSSVEPFSFGQLTSKSSPSTLGTTLSSSSSSSPVTSLGSLDANWKFNFETSSPFKFGSAVSATASPSEKQAPLSFGSFTQSPVDGGLGADPTPKIKALFRKVPASSRDALLEELAAINKELKAAPAADVKLFSSKKVEEPVVAVELAGKESVSTGEEHEDTLFKARAKLYRLQEDKEAADQWIEKGIGEFKINVAKDDKKAVRLIMRMDQTHRLLLNSRVFAQMLITKAGEKSTRFVLAEEGRPVTYLLRVNNPSETEELCKHLREAIDALKE
mmetsp:Transcript_26082/g.65551  ORF Transcript_26082/g.65551 Transcript_26082/m.65551 type:complete len:432 (+) Transcript_26082:161-1456(+)